jgi:hypothetical protein
MNAVSDNTRKAGSWRRMLPLAAILALALAGIGAHPASAKQSVPLTASVAGTVSPTGPGAFALAGSGNASHLGNVKSYRATVQITGGDVVNGPFTDTLTETLTAANGDTITIRCQQVANPVSPGSPVFNGNDTWTVIGGTGHFKNATGSGSGHTHADLNAGTFTKDMTGTIVY